MKKYILLGFVMWLAASCSNFLEEYSQDLAKVENYKDLDEMLIGDGYWRPETVYSEYSMPSLFTPSLTVLHLMPDELNIYRQINGDELDIQEELFGWITWQQQVGMPFKGSTLKKEDRDWNELYKRINVTNQILGAIDAQHAGNREEELGKIRVKGEACFLRAFYYFTLVNMYARPYDPATAAKEAGIPVKLSQQIEDKEYRSESLQEVYALILEDLKKSRECLVQVPVKNHPYRADIVAAHLLTSRVYLYMQDWQNAYNHADSVLQRKSELEDLHTYTEGNFLSKASVETIFSMGGHLIAPIACNYKSDYGGTYPAFIISDEMVGLYGTPDDDNDMRRSKGAYIKQMTPAASANLRMDPVWVFAKVDGIERYTNGMIPCEISDFYLMRTSEAYLNAAEAAAQLGNTTEAVEKLKHLRAHRVQTDNANYTADLFAFIRDERARELLLEGHRWFDLRRYTVNPQHYSKPITHYYTDFNAGNADGSYSTLTYTLAANDDAYTLALPREVTDFQNTLPSVIRPPRPGKTYLEFDGIDMSGEGRKHGYQAGVEAAEADQEAGRPKDNTRNNPLYYTHYVSDYYQFDTYNDAYRSAFREGYDATYQETKSPAELGYQDGLAAGRKDLENDDYEGEHYYDDYNNPFDYDSDEYYEYDDGFLEGYADAWLTIAEKAEKDAQRFLDFIAAGGTEEEAWAKFYKEDDYSTWDEKDEYYYAWDDYLWNAGYYD